MKLTNLKPMLVGMLIGLAVRADAADLHVPTQYPTIQAAVDAASDTDTIHIAPGVYYEQVRIVDKELSLIGQPGTFLRAYPGLVQEEGWGSVLVVRQVTNVVLRGLTFQGDQLANEQAQGMMGALYLDSGGTVENCVFAGFRGAVGLIGEVTNSYPLVVWNDLPGAPLLDFRIAGNTIVDSYHGMQLVGRPETNQVSLNVTIEDNVVEGIGPSLVSAGNGPFTGISLVRGVTGTVARNTVSGFSDAGSGGAYPFGAGIFASSSSYPDFYSIPPLRFEGNTLRNNNTHLNLLLGDESEVVRNRFEGTGPGLLAAGVYFSGKNLLVSGNHFDDMPKGIVVKGDDPIYGLNGGVATNATLIDNRFCNVGTNTTIQPFATATETGSLECPFPGPVLEIAKSVLLTWPEVEEGFVVETAPSLAGPWTQVEATYFLQNSNHSVAVPSDNDQQHFRLVKAP